MQRRLLLSTAIAASVSAAVTLTVVRTVDRGPFSTPPTELDSAVLAAHIFETAMCTQQAQATRADELYRAKLAWNAPQTWEKVLSADAGRAVQVARALGVEIGGAAGRLSFTYGGETLRPTEYRELLIAYERAGGDLLPGWSSGCHEHQHTREARAIVEAYRDASPAERERMRADSNIRFVLTVYGSHFPNPAHP